MTAREHHPYPLPDIAPSIALAQASRYEAARGLQAQHLLHRWPAAGSPGMTAAPRLRHALMVGCLLVLGIMLL